MNALASEKTTQVLSFAFFLKDADCDYRYMPFLTTFLCCVLAQVMCFQQCRPLNHEYLGVLRNFADFFSLYVQLNAIENSCKPEKVLFYSE